MSQITGQRTADVISDLSLRRFLTSLHKLPPNYDTVYTYMYICVLESFSCGGSNPIRSSSLSRQGVPTVTKALVGLSKLPLAKGSSIEKAVLRFFTTFFIIMMHSTYGAPWLTQAILTGLLAAFMDCAPAFAQFQGNALERVEILLH